LIELTAKLKILMAARLEGKVPVGEIALQMYQKSL